MRNRVRKAFTLVEILIVVVILGILAAIVIPQFTTATEEARAGNLAAQLKSIQNQIELFKAKVGRYPTLAEMQEGENDWGVLIAQGYLKDAPRNPAVPDRADSTLVLAAEGEGAGWAYDEATGTLSATYFDESTGTVTPDEAASGEEGP